MPMSGFEPESYVGSVTSNKATQHGKQMAEVVEKVFNGFVI